MAKLSSLAAAKKNLVQLCNEVAETREPIVIERPDGVNVALVSAEELKSLLETAHLVRSNQNAERLLDAIMGAGGTAVGSVDDIRRALGLPPE